MFLDNQSRFERKNAGGRADDAVELKTVLDALKARDAEIQIFATKASAEIAATGKIAAETKAGLEKLTVDGASLSDRLLAVEQKIARRAAVGETRKSLGEQFVERDEFKAGVSKAGNSGHLTERMNVKATLTSLTTDAAGSVGAGIRPDRVSDILMPAERHLTIRDLLLPGRTSSDSIEFVQEVGFNNNAAPVAEGALKPDSDIQFSLLTANVRTIAHLFSASRQVLADVPRLISYIDTRALFGLKYVEEEQLLAGDGTGQNLYGLIPQASDFSESTLSAAGDTRIDTIRRACLQVRLAEYRPTFVVLNPMDWTDIELTKDADGRYIFVNVQVGATLQLWRLAVVETTAMSAGEFLVGATMGAQIFDREDAAIEVSTEHSDYFARNLVAIRAEERLALTVTRPESFVHGHFAVGQSPTLNV